MTVLVLFGCGSNPAPTAVSGAVANAPVIQSALYKFSQQLVCAIQYEPNSNGKFDVIQSTVHSFTQPGCTCSKSMTPGLCAYECGNSAAVNDQIARADCANMAGTEIETP